MEAFPQSGTIVGIPIIQATKRLTNAEALSARGPDNVICSQAWARFGLGASDGCEYLIKFKLLWSLRVVDHDHTTTYYRSKCHSDHVVCLRMYIDAIQKG
ncbi:hypothetical protein KIN20_014997 [Parelaphostrongylus tenuis]|uniref:Uncharacterized protein n=1 Tax=Parelaphostrongylus tenuis TaxID=148309 RepID=A0AAD5ME81_PARTN|nr:hypothetical protein KIN20_014997 [Parelaphostrongylus tenuis]